MLKPETGFGVVASFQNRDMRMMKTNFLQPVNYILFHF